jgi:hypothetical protein
MCHRGGGWRWRWKSSALPAAPAPLAIVSRVTDLVGSVASMFIESWNEEFQAHFAFGEHPPPVFVSDVARALIGNRVITAVRTTYEIGRSSSDGIEQPATWRSWLVLDQSSVAHFEVAFDSVFYDEYEERDRGSQPVPGSVRMCWQRSLADVVGYRITGFGPARCRTHLQQRTNHRITWRSGATWARSTTCGRLPRRSAAGVSALSARRSTGRAHVLVVPTAVPEAGR